jgi:UDP-2,3-diacylglucosamine pyrophosphatase LpxH
MFKRISRILAKNRSVHLDDQEMDGVDAVRPKENLLFLSDLHLGEGCKNVSRMEYLKRSDGLDRHVTSFLEYYTEYRINEMPWRLILGGDLLDFLQVTMTPSEATESEIRYGLGSSETQSVWKLERLFERHRITFVHLADFVGRGNRIEVLQGNHDTELFWPSVREKFVELLSELYFGKESGAACTRSEFIEAITFHPWYFYLPGLLYAEHGHRFDEFCSTLPQLCPLRPENEDELVQPLSAVAIQYFANLEIGFATHDKEHWGLVDYVRYFKGGGLPRGIELCGRYASLAYHSVRYHFESGRHVSDRAQGHHREGLMALAEAGDLSMETIEQLDDMTPKNVMSSFLDVAANVCLGEFTAAVLTLTVCLATLLTNLSWGMDLALIFSTGFISFGAALFNRRRYDRNIRAKLDRAANHISQLIDAPIVCFGHSHAPRLQRMEHNHRYHYVNSGSFLRPHGPQHDDGMPCSCRHTFMMLERPQRFSYPQPQLMNWCPVSREATPLVTASAIVGV